MIAERMKFTDQEAAGFWPVYRQYEADLAAINDKKVSIMKEYISRHQSLNDTQAKQLVEDVFDVDQKTLDLRRKCFAALQKTLPAKTIVRWLQLERRLQLLVDAQLAKDLPGIEK
jgi:CHASE3 domain sensor protein